MNAWPGGLDVTCLAWWVRCCIYAVVNGVSECQAWWVRCCIYAVVNGLSECQTWWGLDVTHVGGLDVAWWVRCCIYAVVNGLSECLAWRVRCCIYAVVNGLNGCECQAWWVRCCICAVVVNAWPGWLDVANCCGKKCSPYCRGFDLCKSVCD